MSELAVLEIPDTVSPEHRAALDSFMDVYAQPDKEMVSLDHLVDEELLPLVEQLRKDPAFWDAMNERLDELKPRLRFLLRRHLVACGLGYSTSKNKREIDWAREALYEMGEMVTTVAGKNGTGLTAPARQLSWEDGIARVIAERNIKVTFEPAGPQAIDVTPEVEHDLQRSLASVTGRGNGDATPGDDEAGADAGVQD